MAGFLHSIMLSKSAYSVTQLEFKPHLAYWILVAPSSGQGQSDGAELAPSDNNMIVSPALIHVICQIILNKRIRDNAFANTIREQTSMCM